MHASRVRGVADLEAAEFQVFSQFGEDGIIQWLVDRTPLGERTFVEFGVENYREANTRLLVEMDDWCGLVIDSSDRHQRFLEESGIAWRHTVVTRTAFLTTENLNAVIGEAGFSGDIDLVSIDVDGMDYWMLESLSIVSPRILIVEYNSLFGPDACVTVPYAPRFDRTTAHYSTLYFGASIRALTELAAAKGYALVGGNSAGTNAFFVRRDVLGDTRQQSPSTAWRQSRVRQARDEAGELTYLSSGAEQRRLIAECPLLDLATGCETTVARAIGS